MKAFIVRKCETTNLFILRYYTIVSVHYCVLCTELYIAVRFLLTLSSTPSVLCVARDRAKARRTFIDRGSVILDRPKLNLSARRHIACRTHAPRSRRDFQFSAAL